MRDGQLIKRARRHRKEPTIAERELWERLRGHKLNGWSFRRQADVAGCVVDFLCHAPALIVEIDGPIHDDGEQRAFDAERDAKLEGAGYAVLRVKERLVRLYIERVEAKIIEVGGLLLRGRALARHDLRME